MSEARINRKGTRPAAILLVNVGLLALFVWTLSETTALRVEVVDGVCAAILEGRTNSIPCPGLAGGQIGLYRVADHKQRSSTDSLNDSLTESLTRNPWRLFIPNSTWRSFTVAGLDGSGAVQLLKAGQPAGTWQSAGGWRTVAGELQALNGRAVMRWPNPLPAAFRLEAGLRRPVDAAGLLLLRPGGSDGFLFLYNSATRLGTWWRWSDGAAAEPIIGAPLQKSLTSQIQSLLRTMLLGHQAGLVLFLASWLLALFMAWAVRRLRRVSEPHGPTRAKWPETSPAPANQEMAPVTRIPGRHTFFRQRAILVGLILWVFALSLFVAGDVLDGVAHVQDSITYRFQAQTLARGRLTAPAPPEPEAFEQEFLLVRDGRWFGKYPPGYPLLLAAGERLGLPWLVNPLLAALTVALLFGLGRIWYTRRVGLLAALLAAVSPFFLIMSGTFMAHATELFWLSLFMVCWSTFIRKRKLSSTTRLAWLVIAGIALGMVFLTRQLTALAAAGPFVLVTTLIRPNQDSWPTRARELAALAVTAAPLALALLLYQGVVTGDPFQDPRLLFWSYDHLGFGGDIGQGQNVAIYDRVQGEPILVWQHDPSQPPRGHSPARGVFNLERNWQQLQTYLFGWLPVVSLAFAWLVFALGRAGRADWIFLVTALTLMIVYVFYWADGIIYGPRYLYAALPALLLLVARGIETSAATIGGRAGRWVVGFIVAALVAGSFFFFAPAAREELEHYNFVDGARLAAVEAAVNGRALIFVAEQNGDWWEYGAYFNGNTPWLDGRIIYARDKGAAANARLQAHFPDRTAYQLQNGQLRPLDGAATSAFLEYGPSSRLLIPFLRGNSG